MECGKLGVFDVNAYEVDTPLMAIEQLVHGHGRRLNLARLGRRAGNALAMLLARFGESKRVDFLRRR